MRLSFTSLYPSPAIPAGMVGAFLLLLGLEEAFPLRKRARSRVPRFLVNFCLSLLSLLIVLLLVTPVSLIVSGWVTEKGFGLIHLFELSWTWELALGLFLMDLSFYYWHRANHTVPLLWRFHLVHHIDPDLDVTTALRFHLGEVLLSTGFRVLQVLLIGVSPRIYLIYEVLFQLNTLFQHSNLHLPIQLERPVNKILVTPRMHGIHHSVIQSETNSNFSVVFSWWDRLHRTLRLNVPQSAVLVGIAAYLRAEDNRLARALSMPFRVQRDPWLFSDGHPAVRTHGYAGSNFAHLSE